VTLDPLYRVIGWLLSLFYIPTHSLGIAVILLTIVIMLVQFPLTAKQAKSMIQMQRVQPEIKKIQQKYKDDKQKQNEELLKFYQENKINPLAGCLPVIITIPIGIAVFRTFSHGVQRHLPQTGKLGTLYHDICGSVDTKACGKHLAKVAHDPPSALHFLGLSLNITARQAQSFGGIGKALPYYIVIALVALTGWYQVKQTQARQLQTGSSGPNAQMQAITKIFPVFFAFICLGLNAGATIYFVVSNIWRIGQQHLVIGKLYDEAIAAGDIKPAGGVGPKASNASDKDPPAKDTPAKDPPAKNAPGNGRGQPARGKSAPPAKGGSAKNPSPPAGSKGSNGSANGKGRQGMSSGARRKKRKR
jgi:YidC/Oxa1 family membrane protein insertase